MMICEISSSLVPIFFSFFQNSAEFFFLFLDMRERTRLSKEAALFQNPFFIIYGSKSSIN